MISTPTATPPDVSQPRIADDAPRRHHGRRALPLLASAASLMPRVQGAFSPCIRIAARSRRSGAGTGAGDGLGAGGGIELGGRSRGRATSLYSRTGTTPARSPAGSGRRPGAAGCATPLAQLLPEPRVPARRPPQRPFRLRQQRRQHTRVPAGAQGACLFQERAGGGGVPAAVAHRRRASSASVWNSGRARSQSSSGSTPCAITASASSSCPSAPAPWPAPRD
jgi:hypothetical protein